MNSFQTLVSVVTPPFHHAEQMIGATSNPLLIS